MTVRQQLVKDLGYLARDSAKAPSIRLLAKRAQDYLKSLPKEPRPQ